MSEIHGEENVGRLLAFVHKNGAGPVILVAGGKAFVDAFEDLPNLDDCTEYDLKPDEELRGLLIFEGWCRWFTSGEETEIEVQGFWRRLDKAELVRLQQGLAPWEDRE